MFIEILHFAIAAFAGTISFNINYNILLRLITLDSLFSALHFIHRFIDNNLTESQIITESNALYTGSNLDRYIYYFMVYLSYKILFNFFWLNESFIYYYIGLFTIVPCVLNRILDSKFFEIIRQKKELFIKTVLAKILTSIIKFCAKVYLNKEDINVKHTEIMEILKDYQETSGYFFSILKSMGIIFGMSYIKNCAPSMYYGLIKYIYNYKTGEMISSFNNNKAKYLISDIIENKKWYELTKANTFKAIIHLYQMNNDNDDFFGKLINDFNFTLIKMFCVWTIASLTGCIYVSPFMALILLLYKRYIRKSDNDNLIGEILLIFLSGVIGYFYNSYFAISFINQFGPKILFNSAIYIILKVIFRNTKELIQEIIMNNRDTTVSFLIIVGYIFLLKSINIESYILISLNLLANILMGTESKKQILFGIILSSTFLSNFAIHHVLFNTSILYILFGLFDFWYKSYTPQDLLKIFLDYIQFKIKKRNIAFEILDTKKYPSISQLGQVIKGCESSSIRDSVSMDDPIFDQSNDMFISSISIESDREYKVKSQGKLDIINNFL